MKLARSPEIFAAGLARALEDDPAFVRRPVGPDARMLMVANRILPAAGVHHMARLAMGLPKLGAMRPGTITLTPAQQAMVLAAKVLPTPVLMRLVSVAGRFNQSPHTPVEEVDING